MWRVIGKIKILKIGDALVWRADKKPHSYEAQFKLRVQPLTICLHAQEIKKPSSEKLG